MGWFSFLKQAASAVPTPSTGKVAIFVDSTSGIPNYKGEDGVAHTLKGDTGPAGAAGSGGTFHGGFTDPTTADNDLIFRKSTTVTTLSILFIGDSITSGQLVTTAPVGPCATDLSLGAVTVTGVNQGVPGSTSAGWAPGGTNYNAAVAAGSAAGSRIAHIMLGTNDSGAPVSQATYRANMIALCDGLVALGYIVVVSYPPYAPDHVTAVTSYCRAIDSLVDNFHIFQGDTQAQTYFHDNPSALQSDNIHPTQAGSDYLAGLWAASLQALVNGITNTKALRRLTLGSTLAVSLVGSTYVLDTASAAGVSSVNGLTGAVVLAAGTNVTFSTSGNTITINSSGGGGGSGVTSIAGLTGAVTVTGGIGIRVTASGSDITLDSLGIPVNRQTGTTYTLQASDNGKAVEMNNAAANVVTIPTGLVDGFNCLITQVGAGQTSVAAGSGATIQNPNATAKCRVQWASLTVRRTNTSSEYLLDGNAAAS